MKRSVLALAALALLAAEKQAQLVQGTSRSRSEGLELHAGGLVVREGEAGAAFGVVKVGDGKRHFPYFIVFKHRLGGTGRTAVSEEASAEDDKGRCLQDVRIDDHGFKLVYKVAAGPDRKLVKEALLFNNKELDPGNGRVILADLSSSPVKWEQVKAKLPEGAPETIGRKEAEELVKKTLASLSRQDKKIKAFIEAARK